MDDDLDESIRRALPSALKTSLGVAKQQSYGLLKYTIEGMDSVCNNAGFLKEYGDEEHLATLEDATKQFAMLQQQISAYKSQLDKIDSLVESGELDADAIDEFIQKSLVEPKMNVTQHEFYKRFCEKAGIELDQGEDEDVVFQETESSRSTICPVTQLEIQKPLRNPSCNHTYSEQGIKAHLQRSKKCPVAGCPQRLSFAQLERDVEMEVLISRKKHDSQQRSQAAASNAAAFGEEEEGDDEEYLVE
ncbi:TPA: hypothetical protein N0F65_001809 [Lagenidium giganteum]|uniref:SP-RING-type domain-containing protein n=1 Tax=Lagenidium giganteum TaxID=4803 RepID=A0AAV2Z7C5_9STRA|nr:TPA: hypothetical protein N0F65_001809 [Lagenidium giganteum]